MTRTRVLPTTLLAICGALIAVSAPSLWATPEADLQCCGVGGSCSGRDYCCPAPTGAECSDEKPYYCMDVCIWPGGPSVNK